MFPNSSTYTSLEWNPTHLHWFSIAVTFSACLSGNVSPGETSAHRHTESPRLRRTNPIFCRGTALGTAASQRRPRVFSPRCLRLHRFHDWPVDSDFFLLLILHGSHRAGVSEKARPRQFGSVNPGHTFFNVSQGKFGLFSLHVS